MKKYAFRLGDLVLVDSEMPPHMRHFPSGERAVVVERSQPQPGYVTYALELEQSGWNAWYHESQLKLIEHDRSALIDEWTDAR